MMNAKHTEQNSSGYVVENIKDDFVLDESSLNDIDGGISTSVLVGVAVGATVGVVGTIMSGGLLAPVAAELGVSIAGGIISAGAATTAGTAVMGGIVGKAVE